MYNSCLAIRRAGSEQRRNDNEKSLTTSSLLYSYEVFLSGLDTGIASWIEIPVEAEKVQIELW
jgi:hypothetical protein